MSFKTLGLGAAILATASLAAFEIPVADNDSPPDPTPGPNTLTNGSKRIDIDSANRTMVD